MNDNTTIDMTKIQFIDELYNYINKENSNPIKQLYLEWTYLQDLYIGALMFLCKNQEDYTYLLSKIDKYNDRLLRDHVLCFPKLNIQESQLENYIKDSKNTKVLLYNSPLTNMFNNTKDLIKYIYDKNHKIGYDEPINVIINIYPLPIIEDVKLYMKNVKEYIGSFFRLGLVSSPIDKLNIQLLLDSDILLIDRFDYFLQDENSSTCQAFFSEPEPKFFDKTIITPKVIDNKEVKKKILDLSKEEIEKIFDITESLCSVGCDFKFINPIIYKKENK